MKKQIWIYSVVVLIIVAAVLVIFFVKFNSQSTMTFYYGRECPHCEKVKAFFADNHTHQKIKFVEKEVFHNKTNLNELIARYRQCNKNPQYVVVPFLWTGKKCILGDVSIISYFKRLEKSNVKTASAQ